MARCNRSPSRWPRPRQPPSATWCPNRGHTSSNSSNSITKTLSPTRAVPVRASKRRTWPARTAVPTREPVRFSRPSTSGKMSRNLQRRWICPCADYLPADASAPSPSPRPSPSTSSGWTLTV
uniref:(northern house mosquito) hypothetical protein n=1 Tax=Culex pipiens TaxID=7175 RepID=A0A8D8KIV5_CULPI